MSTTQALLVPLTLGIDFGSTHTRQSLYREDLPLPVPVEEDSALRNDHRSDLCRDDISSYCTLPWLGNPIVGVHALDKPDRTNLKTVCVILATPTKTTLNTPYAEKLRQIWHNKVERENVRLKVLELLQDHTKHLRNRVNSRLEMMRKPNKVYQISHIAYTIPNWMNMGPVSIAYHDALVKAFDNVPPTSFFPVCESQAIMHSMIKEHGAYLKEEFGNRKGHVFFDWGGTSLNGCMAVVSWDRERLGENNARQGSSGQPQQQGPQPDTYPSPQFFTVTEFGACGGSEQLSFLLMEMIENKLKVDPAYTHYGYSQWTGTRREEVMGKFLKYITAKKQYLSRDEGGEFQPADCDAPVSFTREDMEKVFDGAFRECLDKFVEILGIAKDEWDGHFGVVISGGSVKNSWLRGQIKEEVINRVGDGVPIILCDTVDQESKHTMISKGATYSVVNRISQQEFIQRGAAFGLQVYSVDQLTWSLTADFLNDNDMLPNHWTQKITLSGGPATEKEPKIRIICNPFYQRNSRRTRPDPIHFQGCYDFYELPSKYTRREGDYSFKLGLEAAAGGSITAKLTVRFWRPPEALVPEPPYYRPIARYTDSTIVLPTVFDCGTGTVLPTDEATQAYLRSSTEVQVAVRTGQLPQVSRKRPRRSSAAPKTTAQVAPPHRTMQTRSSSRMIQNGGPAPFGPGQDPATAAVAQGQGGHGPPAPPQQAADADDADGDADGAPDSHHGAPAVSHAEQNPVSHAPAGGGGVADGAGNNARPTQGHRSKRVKVDYGPAHRPGQKLTKK